MMIKSAAALCGLSLVLSAAGGAFAEAGPDGADGCGLHKWGIKRALGLLSDPENPQLASADAEWTRASASAFFLELSPLSQTGILSAMEGATSDPQSLAGAVRLSDLARGEYQISLSEPASIDVFQNGKVVPPKTSSGAAACKIAKSVRVELDRGEAVLRVSGTNAARIGVVIERRPDRPKMRGPRN